MKRMRRILAAAAAVGTALAASVPAAQAAAQMSIWDGVAATPIVIVDGGSGDANAVAGAITWIGSIGVWTVNVDTGLSKPILGTATNGHLDFSFVDVSSGAGTLTLMFTDTDFTGTGPRPLLAEIGGTTGGSVSYDVYADSSNTPFGMEQHLTSLSFGASPYAGGESALFNTSGLYSLTQVITISHRAAGVSSGDAEARVPEPASMALLGLGLAGLGWARRRRA